MARALKKPGQAGAADAAAAASNEDLARLSEEVAALASLDLNELRGRWRKVFRAPASVGKSFRTSAIDPKAD